MRHQRGRDVFPAGQIPTIHLDIDTPTTSSDTPHKPRPDVGSDTSATPTHHMCSAFFLMCFSLCMGSVAACSMALSLATDSWLFTREPYRFSQAELDAWNITDRKLLPRIEVNVRSGLWRVCTTGIAGSADLCIPIDYSQLGSGRLSGAPTCMAVVGAIRYSSPAFVIAMIIVITATALLFIGVVQRSAKTLLASVLYVATGLSVAIAIIIYISAINDEVGYSSRKSRHIDFNYRYGWSFFSVCLAFLASEGAAVVSTLHHMRVRDRLHNDVIPEEEKEMVHYPCMSTDHETFRIWNSFDGDVTYDPS